MDASDYDLVFPDTVEPAPVPAAVLPPPSPALITRRVMPGTSIRRLRNRSSAWPRRTHDAGKERLRCG